MKGLIWLIIIIIVVGGIYFFMSSDEQSLTDDNSSIETDNEVMNDETMSDESVMTDEEITETNSPTTNNGEDTEALVQEFLVEGSSFKYVPNQIEVKKGVPVRIVFKNVGGFHDWVIDEFDARTSQIREGETETITFVPDQVGTFEFYCSVGNHRQQGMVGSLIVTE